MTTEVIGIGHNIGHRGTVGRASLIRDIDAGLR